MLLAGRVYAASITNQTQTNTDPNVPYNLSTEVIGATYPKEVWPTGNKEPKIIRMAPSTTQAPKTLSAASVKLTGLSNEVIVWEFLLSQGFTRNQTAGIMGNIKQEHNFQTSGDGLAQWYGGRKARLLAMPDPYSLNTQLSFLVLELNELGINLPDDVVLATRTFQNVFERCGICNETSRINYAYDILERNK